jgi:hypothetical protein
MDMGTGLCSKQSGSPIMLQSTLPEVIRHGLDLSQKALNRKSERIPRSLLRG